MNCHFKAHSCHRVEDMQEGNDRNKNTCERLLLKNLVREKGDLDTVIGSENYECMNVVVHMCTDICTCYFLEKAPTGLVNQQ